jgi:hypothetical protein
LKVRAKDGERNARQATARTDIRQRGAAREDRTQREAVYEMLAEELMRGLGSGEVDSGVPLEHSVGIGDQGGASPVGERDVPLATKLIE